MKHTLTLHDAPTCHEMPTIESGSIYETKPSPLRLERIVEEAQNFAFNPLIPLKYWLRTASTLLKEVSIAGYLIKMKQANLTH